METPSYLSPRVGDLIRLTYPQGQFVWTDAHFEKEHLLKFMEVGDPDGDRAFSIIGGVDVSDEALERLRVGDPGLYARLTHIPAWVDFDEIDYAQSCFLRYYTAMVSSYALALLGGFSCPSINRVLLHSRYWVGDDGPGGYAGRLDTFKRLLETLNWVFHVMLPGAQKPLARGWRATFKVRLLHAKVRRHVLAHVAAKGAKVAGMEAVKAAGGGNDAASLHYNSPHREENVAASDLQDAEEGHGALNGSSEASDAPLFKSASAPRDEADELRAKASACPILRGEVLKKNKTAAPLPPGGPLDEGLVVRSSRSSVCPVSEDPHAFPFMEGGWDGMGGGVPINALHLRATLTAFHTAPVAFLREQFGMELSDRDKAAWTLLWRWVGRTVGIHEDVLYMDTYRDSVVFMESMSCALLQHPDETSVALVSHMVRTLNEFSNMRKLGNKQWWVDAYRLSVGEKAGDAMELPRGSVYRWVMRAMFRSIGLMYRAAEAVGLNGLLGTLTEAMVRRTVQQHCIEFNVNTKTLRFPFPWDCSAAL